MQHLEIEHESEKKIIAAVGVLIFKENKVLLVKHKEASGHMNDVYGLPAGRKQMGETEKDTAVRELKEETGISTTTENLFDYPHNIYTADIERKDNTLSMMSIHVYLCNSYQGILQANDETDPEWIPLVRLGSLNLLPNILQAIKDGYFYLQNAQVGE